jgi:membrane protease YdiL (CAAX protease family)
MKNTTFKTSIIVIITLVVYFICFRYFRVILQNIDEIINLYILSYFFAYVIIGIPVFIGASIINKNINILKHLGLRSNLLKAFLFSIIFSLPMFLGGILFFSFNNDITISTLIKITLFAGFFEELYFRGFLFGQLYRNSRLGFIPSILLSAVLFASGHLYQSSDLSTIIGIFITTFMGAVFFAWLYVEWNYNLWVPICLHFLMNLSWAVFSVSENALGNVTSNIFRGCTIALAIIITIIYKRRKGLKLEINKTSLFWKESI